VKNFHAAFFHLAVALLLCSGSLLVAQTPTGSISGLVKDESGAVIPGANVVITNTETGIRRTIPSDSGGRYRVPGLDAGLYQWKRRRLGSSDPCAWVFS
jgi:hypothetical protein